MTTAVHTPAASQSVVIHHLSDLHYQQQPPGVGDNPLIRYWGYLEQLEQPKRPDLIVITGDLTSTGSSNDLRTVAELLRTHFPAWERNLASHIFVVPGPRDLNWEGSSAPGLALFYDAFRDFGLPSMAHMAPQVESSVRSSLRCIAYPIDTCYSLDECRAEMGEQFHQYRTSYHAFVNQYQHVRARPASRFGFGVRNRMAELAALHQRYLKLTEANDLTMLDAGRVSAADLAAFQGWAGSLRPGQGGQQPTIDPLKILITHHPLAVQPELGAPPPGQPQGVAQPVSGFDRLTSAAGQAGFHLALHGHIHKPQVLSDLSLLREPSAQHPLRQVGAGSLGDGRTFNEITAIYSDGGDLNHWRIEIRTINLDAPNPHDATTWVLLNRTEDATKQAEELASVKSRREDFDRGVQSAMQQFAEVAFRSQPDDPFERSVPEMLPQAALQNVDGIIQRIVFPEFDVRVRLYLKDKQNAKATPNLTAVYLAPPFSNAGPVAYPYSLAALSLVLGRTLVYPRDLTWRMDGQDYQWLRRSGKDKDLLRVMEALVREPPPSGAPAAEDAQRYQALLTRLDQGMADDGQTDPLSGADFYREVTAQGTRPTYPVFVCVPYPKRPPEGVGPKLPEVAVLVVSLRAGGMGGPAGLDARATPTTLEQKAFTPERIGMLESLTQLIGMILISSSTAGKPKGVWDDRFRN